MKKILSTMLVLVLCLLPLSGMAEATRESFSLSNVKLSAEGQTLPEIGAALILSVVGGEDGNGLVDLEVLSDANTKPLGKLSIGSQEGGLIAALDGMSSVYTISQEELEMLMQDAMAAQSQAELPEGLDLKGSVEFMTEYFDCLRLLIEGEIQMVKDLEGAEPEVKTKVQAAEWEAMGVDLSAEYPTEEVTVLDETRSLQYLGEYTYDMEKVFAALSEFSDGYAKCSEAYKKMLDLENKMIALGYEDADLNQLAANAKVKVWVDDLQKPEWMYTEMAMPVEIGEESFETAIMEEHIQEDALQMRVTMDMSDMIGEEARVVVDMEGNDNELNMDMAVTEANQPTVNVNLKGVYEETGENGGNLNVTMTVKQDETEMGVIELTGAYDRTPEGEETLNGALSVMEAGSELASIAIDYKGTVAENGEDFERSGDVTLSLNTPETGKMDVGFAIGYKKEAVTGDAFEAIKALPQVKLTDLMNDAELQQSALMELQSFVMRFMGGLMQIPGLSDIIMQTTMSSMAASETDDYATGYDSEYVDIA